MAHTSRWHCAARTVNLRPSLSCTQATQQAHPDFPVRRQPLILTLCLAIMAMLLGPALLVSQSAFAQEAAPLTPETAPAPASASLPGSAEPAPDSAAAPAPTPAPAQNQPAKPVPSTGVNLRILAPADHMPAWLKAQIQARTGATVVVDTYKTDAEAVQKVQQSSSAPYDLLCISDRVAADLVRQQKLSPVTWPVNKDIVYGRYRGHYFDQENRLTLAYAVSLSGYAYKISDFPKPPTGWEEVLGADLAGVYWRPDAQWRKALLGHAGKQVEANDPRLAAAPATTARLVVDTVPELCRRFGADSRNWKIVLPNTGSIICLYQVAVPVGAEHPREAMAAVQELFGPRTLAKLSMETLTAVTTPGAFKQLPAQYASHPLLYPADHALDNSVFVKVK